MLCAVTRHEHEHEPWIPPRPTEGDRETRRNGKGGGGRRQGNGRRDTEGVLQEVGRLKI